MSTTFVPTRRVTPPSLDLNQSSNGGTEEDPAVSQLFPRCTPKTTPTNTPSGTKSIVGAEKTKKVVKKKKKKKVVSSEGAPGHEDHSAASNAPNPAQVPTKPVKKVKKKVVKAKKDNVAVDNILDLSFDPSTTATNSSRANGVIPLAVPPLNPLPVGSNQPPVSMTSYQGMNVVLSPTAPPSQQMSRMDATKIVSGQALVSSSSSSSNSSPPNSGNVEGADNKIEIAGGREVYSRSRVGRHKQRGGEAPKQTQQRRKPEQQHILPQAPPQYQQYSDQGVLASPTEEAAVRPEESHYSSQDLYSQQYPAGPPPQPLYTELEQLQNSEVDLVAGIAECDVNVTYDLIEGSFPPPTGGLTVKVHEGGTVQHIPASNAHKQQSVDLLSNTPGPQDYIMMGEEAGNKVEDNSHGEAGSVGSVESLRLDQHQEQLQLQQQHPQNRTIANQPKNAMGSISIAEYEGSPRRYRPRPSEQGDQQLPPNQQPQQRQSKVKSTSNTSSSSSTPSSSSSKGQKTKRSKVPAGSRLPGFPQRVVATTQPREGEVHSSESNGAKTSSPSSSTSSSVRRGNKGGGNSTSNGSSKGSTAPVSEASSAQPSVQATPSRGHADQQQYTNDVLMKFDDLERENSDLQDTVSPQSVQERQQQQAASYNYQYEFSETRKVLDEFFHHTNQPQQAATGNQGPCDTKVEEPSSDLDYTLRRRQETSNHSSADNSPYVGQRLASNLESSDNPVMFLPNSSNGDQHILGMPPLADQPPLLNLSGEAANPSQTPRRNQVAQPTYHQPIQQQHYNIQQNNSDTGYATLNSPEAASRAGHHPSQAAQQPARSVQKPLPGHDQGQVTPSGAAQGPGGDYSRNFTLSPETTDCDSADLESEVSVGEGSFQSSGPRIHTAMPILEDGLSSGHASDLEEDVIYSSSGSVVLKKSNAQTSPNNSDPRLLKHQQQLNSAVATAVNKTSSSQHINRPVSSKNGVSKPDKSGRSDNVAYQQHPQSVIHQSRSDSHNPVSSAVLTSNLQLQRSPTQTQTGSSSSENLSQSSQQQLTQQQLAQQQLAHQQLTQQELTQQQVLSQQPPTQHEQQESVAAALKDIKLAIQSTRVLQQQEAAAQAASSVAMTAEEQLQMQQRQNFEAALSVGMPTRILPMGTSTVGITSSADILTSTTITSVDQESDPWIMRQQQNVADFSTSDVPPPLTSEPEEEEEVGETEDEEDEEIEDEEVEEESEEESGGEEEEEEEEDDEEEGEEEISSEEIVEERVPTPKNIKEEEDLDTDQETDRLLGQQYNDDNGYYDSKNEIAKKKGTTTKTKEAVTDPKVLIEGVLFRARYLGSTQLVCEGQPTKATRMMQAEEAVSRIKALAPEGDNQPSTEVDLFISTEKIMVLNTDLKEIMMDHALRSISYIADIGELLVIMARRRIIPSEGEDVQVIGTTPKMICHVFESEEAQFIAQSIGQAFQVAYMEFLKANGIEDHSFVKEMDYQEVLNSQEIFGDELAMFARKELQKEVVVPKAKGEILGVVIVESGWGSMLPTIVLANLSPTGPAARCGQLNIGDQIIAINGISLVGLPLSTCQTYIKNTKNKTAVKLTAVSCAPVVEVKIKRPDTKYQLGFSVQNGVICSLLRGGIAERGGVRVGHRIIEINGQSVVAVPHERIVNLLATSVGEITMKTMPTSMYRLLTGQENPLYI